MTEEFNGEKNFEENKNLRLDFGKWLQSFRLKEEVSLEEVAAETKIHIEQLQFMEAEWPEAELPAMAFIRGFLVNYSRYLKLNPELVLQKFKEAYFTQEEQARLFLKQESHPEQEGVRIINNNKMTLSPGSKIVEPKKWWFLSKRFLSLVFLLIFLSTLWVYFINVGKKELQKNFEARKQPHSQNLEKAGPVSTVPKLKSTLVSPLEKIEKEELKAQVILETKEKEKKSAEAGKISAEKTPLAEQSLEAPYEVSVRALKKCWVSVKVDGTASPSFPLSAGSVKKYTAQKEFYLSVSEARALELTINKRKFRINGYDRTVDIVIPKQINRLKPVVTKP